MLSLRTLLRHPLQFIIMTFGIALGVAVMVSIDLANASAARAFDLSTSAVTGRATHAIVGSAQSLDECIYVQLRTHPKWRDTLESAPLVIAYGVSPQLGESTLSQLPGITRPTTPGGSRLASDCARGSAALRTDGSTLRLATLSTFQTR
jgi:putative ABC transport system permease protein